MLDAFGITEEEIRRDLQFVRRQYFPEDGDTEPEAEAAVGGVGT
jgi:hypothetical protein